MQAARAPVPNVVMQHVADVAALRNARRFVVRAPNVRLLHLGRLDERLAAHLDGVAIAAGYGMQLADAALGSPGAGEVFAAAVRRIEMGDTPAIHRLLALAQAVPESQAGLFSAFGWCSAGLLQGLASTMLEGADPFAGCLGIAACAMHRVDPGAALDQGLAADNSALRSRALRCAGELGRRDLIPACAEQLNDEDPRRAFWAAWSTVLLGARGGALDRLEGFCRTAFPDRQRALQLVLKTVDNRAANDLLQALALDAGSARALVRGAGISGDPFYLQWLINKMSDPRMARLAGESFSLITGLDVAWLDLDTDRAEFESGPNDDPDDDNVALDEDDGLPWPDPAKLQAWWEVNHQRFQPGVRYFMGAPPSVEHCKRVLREGYQRQRVAAAEYLCLLTPGTPLFPTSAPAWRQQRWLRQMG